MKKIAIAFTLIIVSVAFNSCTDDDTLEEVENNIKINKLEQRNDEKIKLIDKDDVETTTTKG